MLPMTRTYVKELKRDRELMKDPEYVVLIKKPNAYKKKLARKNNHIVRVDIYNADFGYMDGNSTKSLDQYRLVGEITEDNHQLRDFKKVFKKVISSKVTVMDIALDSPRWINIVYDDGTNVIANVLGYGNTILRVYDCRVDEIPRERDFISFNLNVSAEFGKIIKANIVRE